MTRTSGNSVKQDIPTHTLQADTSHKKTPHSTHTPSVKLIPNPQRNDHELHYHLRPQSTEPMTIPSLLVSARRLDTLFKGGQTGLHVIRPIELERWKFRYIAR